MASYEAAYRGARQRFSELCGTASHEQLGAKVPACPDCSAP